MNPRYRKLSPSIPQELEESNRRAVTPIYSRKGFEQPYRLYSPRRNHWRQAPSLNKYRDVRDYQTKAAEYRQFREVTPEGTNQFPNRKMQEFGYYQNSDNDDYRDRQSHRKDKSNLRVTPVKDKRPNRWDRNGKHSSLLYGEEDPLGISSRSRNRFRHKDLLQKSARNHHFSPERLERSLKFAEQAEKFVNNFSARNVYTNKIDSRVEDFSVSLREGFDKQNSRPVLGMRYEDQNRINGPPGVPESFVDNALEVWRPPANHKSSKLDRRKKANRNNSQKNLGLKSKSPLNRRFSKY